MPKSGTKRTQSMKEKVSLAERKAKRSGVFQDGDMSDLLKTPKRQAKKKGGSVKKGKC